MSEEPENSQASNVAHNIRGSTYKVLVLLGDEQGKAWLEKTKINGIDPLLEAFKGRDDFLELASQYEESGKPERVKEQTVIINFVNKLLQTSEHISNHWQSLEHYVLRFNSLAIKFNESAQNLKGEEKRKYERAANYATTLSSQLEALRQQYAFNDNGLKLLLYLKGTPKTPHKEWTAEEKALFSQVHDGRSDFTTQLQAISSENHQKAANAGANLSEALEKLIKSTSYKNHALTAYTEAKALLQIKLPGSIPAKENQDKPQQDNESYALRRAKKYKNELDALLKNLLESPALKLAIAPNAIEHWSDEHSQIPKSLIEAIDRFCEAYDEYAKTNPLEYYAGMVRSTKPVYQQAYETLQNIKRSIPADSSEIIDLLQAAFQTYIKDAQGTRDYVKNNQQSQVRFMAFAEQKEQMAGMLLGIIDVLQADMEVKRTLRLLGNKNMESVLTGNRHEDIIDAAQGRQGSKTDTSTLAELSYRLNEMQEAPAAQKAEKTRAAVDALNKTLIAHAKLLERYPDFNPKALKQPLDNDPAQTPQEKFEQGLAKQLHVLKEIFAFQLQAVKSTDSSRKQR